MEFKFMKNPEIIGFLAQYDKSEWDTIIEDLIMNSINQIKEIEKKEKPPKKIENKTRTTNKMSDIIIFNNSNSEPYECAANLIMKNAESKLNRSNEKDNLKKLDELSIKIGNVHSDKKNNKSSKKSNK